MASFRLGRSIPDHLVLELGHAPPYTAEEIESIDVVVLEEVSELKGLESLKFINSLSMRSSALRSLDGCEHLEVLWTFKAWFSSLEDISALAHCKEITQIDLDCCLVEDVSPLLELPKLNRLNLNGNPLSPASYYEVVPKLRETIINNRRGKSPAKPTHTAEPDWKLGRELWERGLRAVFYRNDDIPRLAFPGLAITPQPELDRYDLAPEVLRGILDRGKLDTKELYELLKGMSWEARTGKV